MLVNPVIDRWRTTLNPIFLPVFYRSLADNIKISHKEGVYSTMVLLLSLSISIIYDLSGKSMYMQSNRYSLWRISELFMKFTKEDARKRVLNCAKQYQQNLLHKKLLIIFRERQDNSIRFIEVIFHERNYQHLTGLELTNTEGKILQHQSKNFYRKCIENKLGLNEFQFKSDGTSHLKLAALPILMDVSKITKITGDYNNLRPYLFVDKVMGGVNFCLGLSRENDVFIPSSALLEDIKSLPPLLLRFSQFSKKISTLSSIPPSNTLPKVLIFTI